MARLRSLAPADALVLSGIAALILTTGIYGIAAHPWPDNWDATDYSARFVELADRLREGPLAFLDGFPGTHGPLLPLVASAALTLRAWANPYWPLALIELAALAGTVALLYIALRRFLGIPTAIVGTVVYAATLNQIYWSTQVLYEGFGYLLTPCLLLSLDRDSRLLTTRSARLAGLFVGLTTLTRLNFAIPALAVLLLHVLLVRPPSRVTHLRALLEPIVLTTGLWYGATIWHTAVYYSSYANYDPALGLFWNSPSQSWLGIQRDYLLYVWDRWGTGAMAVLVAAIASSPWTIAHAWRDRRSGLTPLASFFVVATFALCLAMSGKTERYLTPALLPALVVLGSMVAARGGTPAAATLRGLLVAAAALQVAGLLTHLGRSDAPPSAVLQGPAASPWRYWEHSNAAAATLARTTAIVGDGAPLLFIGHGAEMDNVTVRYWNLARRTHLAIDYGWDPLQPDASAQAIPEKIARARWVLFAPAHNGESHFYQHASDVTAAALASLVQSGHAVQVLSDSTALLYEIRSEMSAGGASVEASQ